MFFWHNTRRLYFEPQGISLSSKGFGLYGIFIKFKVWISMGANDYLGSRLPAKLESYSIRVEGYFAWVWDLSDMDGYVKWLWPLSWAVFVFFLIKWKEKRLEGCIELYICIAPCLILLHGDTLFPWRFLFLGINVYECMWFLLRR